ncbi:MAG: type II methionyl aminopeptidase [archaeon]
MDSDIVKKYLKAGEILKETQEEARKIIKSEAKLLEIAESIEKFIEKKGGKPAFPVNLSFNNEAAHRTADINDELTIKKEDVLKVDIGVQVDGYIADSAFTVNLSGEWKKMIKVNETALNEALKLVQENGAGLEIKKIGEIIEKTIKEAGFKPVQNLTGHGLEKYMQHAPPSIPNIATNDSKRFEDNKVYAIEPFVTNGSGFVKEGSACQIFMADEVKPTRDRNARKIMELILKEYETLPFAERWISDKIKMSEFERKIAFRELMQKKCIRSYPILKDENGCIVTQAENSFLINDGKVILLVK